MATLSSRAGVHVFLFGHQDDEFAVFRHLELLVAQSQQVRCIYLTDGSARGSSPALRAAESTRVLGAIGIPPDSITFLGTSEGLRDGHLHEVMLRARDALLRSLGSTPVAAVYVPAWEGGHHDHDSTHAIGLQVGHSLGVSEVFQYPLYNGATTRGPWFSILRPLPANGPVDQARFTLSAAVRYIGWCLSYRTQWRTWMGLLPFVVWRLLLGRSMPLQPCRMERLEERPHPGPLYYERRFGIPFQDVAAATAELRAAST
jgi:LmbE family N-acetylglucosaminyl deacetylase